VANINRVVLVGNLTRDPELRTTPGGLSVCSLRLAVNHRRKNGQTGEWIDEPNYFDISVFGAQADNCSRFLAKGRQVGVDGRLRWREWEAQDGSKRQAVEVVADTVQFIGGRDGAESGGAGGGGYARREAAPVASAPQSDPWGSAAGDDDDIPF
jgi:single-strand DNA-binding protein